MQNALRKFVYRARREGYYSVVLSCMRNGLGNSDTIFFDNSFLTSMQARYP